MTLYPDTLRERSRPVRDYGFNVLTVSINLKHNCTADKTNRI